MRKEKRKPSHLSCHSYNVAHHIHCRSVLSDCIVNRHVLWGMVNLYNSNRSSQYFAKNSALQYFSLSVVICSIYRCYFYFWNTFMMGVRCIRGWCHRSVAALCSINNSHTLRLSRFRPTWLSVICRSNTMWVMILK